MNLARVLINLLDPQVVQCGGHKIGNIAPVPTESSHHRRVIVNAIPHFNEILAEAIHIDCEEGDVDICPLGQRDQVDAVGHSRISIRVGWGHDEASFIREVATTFNICKS